MKQNEDMWHLCFFCAMFRLCLYTYLLLSYFNAHCPNSKNSNQRPCMQVHHCFIGLHVLDLVENCHANNESCDVRSSGVLAGGAGGATAPPESEI